MIYGDIHRFFLRTVASQGVLSLREAKKCTEKFTVNEPINIQELIKEINDKIRPYQQEIKLTSNEVSGEEVVVFISLGYDDASKSQTVFSPAELDYFRVLIEQILSNDSRQISGEHATKKFDIKRFTKAEAKKLLSIWCKMYYLEKDGRNYALGVRAIHEFEGYFRQNMPYLIDESSCSLCNKIVFRGYTCPNCSKSIHSRCLINFLKNVKKWPCCKFDYDDKQLEEDYNESSRLEETHNITETQQSAAYEVIDMPDREDSTDDVEMIDIDAPGPSRRVTRKRKYTFD